MKITFKDVGQGDSIIVEWEIMGVPKVAIIDCNKKGKMNPVLEHIAGRYKEIEFIILTHPHSDHYSGFVELWAYIEKEKIRVNRFGLTLENIGKKFWQLFEVTPEETKDLEDVISGAIRLRDDFGFIKKIVSLVEDWSIPLGDGIEIRCLAPSIEEKSIYQKSIKYGVEYEKKASQSANYLSTVLWLSKNDKNILLTSDSVIETFERIQREERFEGIEFCICQAPHHGSYNNYSEIFWDSLKLSSKKSVVFSSGKQEKYKHPHLATVKEFAKKNYKIFPTNVIYGMKDFLDEISKNTLILDTISDIDISSIVDGDKIFDID